tara:strand:- start:266 stop:460 length:195 start_codon:yes stop_codon:yes gene_type:complete
MVSAAAALLNRASAFGVKRDTLTARLNPTKHPTAILAYLYRNYSNHSQANQQSEPKLNKGKTNE